MRRHSPSVFLLFVLSSEANPVIRTEYNGVRTNSRHERWVAPVQRQEAEHTVVIRQVAGI